jgi:hypothetical protein
MLHMVHIYVASVLSECCICFTMIFKCFSGDMLQMLYLDVSKVNRVLYLSPRFLLPHLGVSSSSRHRLGIHTPSLLAAGDVQDSAGPFGHAKRHGKQL